MFIVRSAQSSITPFGGAESQQALPLKSYSAPPNGVSSICLSVYKHVTPHGVKSLV